MDLTLGVEKIKGVGPKTAAELAKAGFLTLRDLLYFLPRDYENYQAAAKIADIKPGKIIIRGQIDSLKTSRTRRRNLTITEGVIQDKSGAIRVVWFNQPYRKKQFLPGKDYYFTGQYDFNHNRYQLVSPSAILASDLDQTTNFQPIYRQKSGVRPQLMKKLIQNLRPNFALIPDFLPGDQFRAKTRAEALFKVHFPENKKDAELGRQYLAYEEIFTLILAAKLNKQENQRLRAIQLPFQAEKTKKLVEKLPFRLTNAQRLATWDILQDLERATPMNRLLQGDVGSGKTVVAALAAHQTAQNGHQTALLAPTAILAAQHAESLRTLLKPFGVEVALLTGATKQKTTLKERIRTGAVDLVVGTHALLTDDTMFYSLGLCIIDEQHRLGVAQRQRLLAKPSLNSPETAPHLLAMTATPIPRSLQLTIFGDLDISILDQLPAGRQPIKTKIINETNSRDDLYPLIRDTAKRGEQIYWICKAIEENPQTETASVKKQAQKLQDLFPRLKVEFLHGRMKTEEKDRIMEEFATGSIDLLVSTTVVEVGVDVPNASLIVIQDAEQYGLAQLHQLRGRVGRGTKQSYCYLVTTGENPPSRRLRELEKSNDGFYLSEVDLKLRGPGEIYGNLQHGALDLRIATLSDTKLLAKAAKHAQETATAFAKEPTLMVKYKELGQVIRKYQQLTILN